MSKQSSKCTEEKRQKTYFSTNGFSSFLDFEKKNLCFYRKFFSRVVKTTSYVSRGPLTEQHLRKEVLKTWGFSNKFKVLGTMAENLFWIGKTAIDVRREHIIEKCFQKRKIHYVFPFLSDYLVWAKKFARFAEPAIYGFVEAFGDFFLKFHKSFTLIWNFFQKTLIWKFFSGLSQLQCALLEAYFEEKEVFKTKLFLFICFGVWPIFQSVDKKSQGVKETT